MVSQRLPLSQIDAPIDGAAAHRVADQVIVQAVAAEHAFLAEVAELGVADRAGRVAVVHRVAATPSRVGRLDDDVAAQVGDLAAIVAVGDDGRSAAAWSSVRLVPSMALMMRSSVWVLSRTLGGTSSSVLFCRVVAVRMTRSPARQPVTASASVTSVSPSFAVRAELDPGAAQREHRGSPCGRRSRRSAGHDSLSMPSK